MPIEQKRAAFVAGDWGTSSLRLWACAADGAVLAERRSDEGMSRLDPDGFEPALRRHIEAMRPVLQDGPQMLPVVLCGMAGARQGWREAGYVGIPAAPEAVLAEALPVPAAGLDVRILPGLADRRAGRENVMRGEETQLLGLSRDAPGLSGAVCMPGTHSKWVVMEAGRVAAFETAMTGELFALLRRHSVLRHSAGDGPVDPASDAFARGAGRGLDAPQRLPATLFSIRAADLLGADGDGGDMLSGLLIGAEIAACAGGAGSVALVADGALAAAYGRALSLAGLETRVIGAEAATLAGLRAAAARLWPQAFG